MIISITNDFRPVPDFFLDIGGKYDWEMGKMDIGWKHWPRGSLYLSYCLYNKRDLLYRHGWCMPTLTTANKGPQNI